MDEVRSLCSVLYCQEELCVTGCHLDFREVERERELQRVSYESTIYRKSINHIKLDKDLNSNRCYLYLISLMCTKKVKVSITSNFVS